MKVRLNDSLALIIALIIIALAIKGCGNGEDEEVAIISATPASGDIEENGAITVTFDGTPTEVAVTAGTVTVVGKTATIAGPFTPGPLALTITWADGQQTLNYNVKPPHDVIAPTVVGGMFGDVGWDNDPEYVDTDGETINLADYIKPEALNADGQIKVFFSEDVTGDIALKDGYGDDVGWRGIVQGNTGTLKLARGEELSREEIYFIVGTVNDRAGNELEIEIIFYTEEFPPASFVSAIPLEGSEIAPNATITVVFDNRPDRASVNINYITVVGKTATIAGPFTPGPLALTITWDDGSVTLNYFVTVPDTTAPIVVGGTVSNGDVDVDPEWINADGEIEVFFSEDVIGRLKLQTEGGDDVGWLDSVKGNRGTLQLVRGRELDPATTYVIVCEVSDAAGNHVWISITFVTRIKE